MYLTCCKQRNKGRTNRIERLRIFNPSFSLPWCCKEDVRKRRKEKKHQILYPSLSPHSICQRKTRNKENKNTVHTFFFVLFFKSFVSFCPVGILKRKRNKRITIVLIQSESFFSPKVSSWESSEIIYLANCPYLILPGAILGIQGYPLALFLLCTEPQVFIS